MIKKKLSIFLLLFSAVLFLKLLNTTSYAYEPTKNELKNFFYNYALYYYGNTLDAETNATNLVNNLDDSRLDEWLGYISRYQGKYVLSAHNGKVFYWCYTGNVTNLQNHHASYINGYDNDKIGINNSYLSAWIWTYDLASNTFYNYQTSSDIQLTYIYNTSASQRKNWFYTDTNVYNYANQQYTTIKWASGYMTPSNLFDGSYNDSAFDIDINADFRNNKATISNDTSGTEYYLIPYTSNKVRIGNMFDYSNLAGVVKRKFRYKQATRSFELFQEYQADTNNLEFFDIADDTLIVFEYYQPDTTEFITFIPKADTGFSQFTVPIYYTSANTSIINGVIDTGDTFSGDNYNNYNNDTNTDKIINNVNDDSNVVGQLNEFVSGDTEDLAKKLGFQLIGGMDYYNFIQNTIRNTFNILSEEENVYFDYSMHGETPTRIYASNFTTPPSLFKTFGCLFLIACTIFVFYFQMTTFFESLATLQFTSAIDWLTIDRSIFRM